jgi:hypothetical protein
MLVGDGTQAVEGWFYLPRAGSYAVSAQLRWKDQAPPQEQSLEVGSDQVLVHPLGSGAFEVRLSAERLAQLRGLRQN